LSNSKGKALMYDGTADAFRNRGSFCGLERSPRKSRSKTFARSPCCATRSGADIYIAAVRRTARFLLKALNSQSCLQTSAVSLEVGQRRFRPVSVVSLSGKIGEEVFDTSGADYPTLAKLGHVSSAL
jgi:hypothetical protein